MAIYSLETQAALLFASFKKSTINLFESIFFVLSIDISTMRACFVIRSINPGKSMSVCLLLFKWGWDSSVFAGVVNLEEK